MKKFCTTLFLSAIIATGFAQTDFPEWEKGYFDIHHIETGGGNSSFLIFPDGTTMLIDAGVLNFKRILVQDNSDTQQLRSKTARFVATNTN